MSPISINPAAGPLSKLCRLRLRSEDICMALKNSDRGYGTVSRLLHWLTATFIFVALPLGWRAASIGPRNPDPPLAALRETLLFWHKSAGLSVLLLIVLRIGWFLYSARPPLPASLPSIERIGAKTIHYLLYAMLIGMPISGIVLSQAAGFPVSFYGLVDLPKIVLADQAVPLPQRPELIVGVIFHERIFAFALYAALLLHFAGLAKHSLIDRDHSVWRRMGGRLDG